MAGEFGGVDLSKLPAPDAPEQISFEVIFADMLADLRARLPVFGALVESDPAYAILQVAAYRETLIRRDASDKFRSGLLAYATGAGLEHIGALFEVERLTLDPGDPASGVLPTLESDLDLRRRIHLAPEGYTTAGSVGAYLFHALGAHPDVLDANPTSPAPMQVLVSVLSRSSDGTASAAVLAAVDAALSANKVRPLTDLVTVATAAIVPYTIDATLYTFDGPDSAVVIAAAIARANAFAQESRRIGRDIALSAIYAALHVDGVRRVALASPLADIVIGGNQAPFATAVNIVWGGVGE